MMVLPDFTLGSLHAITRDGTLVVASALGSQLASYAWGAANVIFVVGAQKLVPDLDTARERIYEHSFKLEDARALEAYGKNSRVGKILEIHEEDPGRIHVVLIREAVGFRLAILPSPGLPSRPKDSPLRNRPRIDRISNGQRRGCAMPALVVAGSPAVLLFERSPAPVRRHAKTRPYCYYGGPEKRRSPLYKRASSNRGARI